MRWVSVAIWLILFCGLWIRSIDAEPPFSGVGYCSSGQVVNGLNQNAPPHCIPNGGGGGGTNLKPYNGGVQITATPNDGSNFENGVCHDGVCPATAFNIQCDGVTDNEPGPLGPLQSFINAAQFSVAAGTGLGQIPASCNGSPGHQILFSNPITIPDNVIIAGLAGECHSGADCVELDYTGTGTAITSTNTNGSGLKNIRLKTTTGAIGLDLQGTFKFSLVGSNITGFSTNGVLIEDSASSSALYTRFTDVLLNANGIGLYLDQHNSGKVVNANTFENVQALSSTGAENIHFTGNANENVFKDLDMSHATTGLLCDAFSCRDTLLNEVTAEGDPTVFNLGQDVQNFEAFAVDGGFFNGSNGTPILADGTATYSVCWGVLGNTADECDFQGVRRYTYLESVAFQDSTQQATLGQHGNSLLQSNTFQNASWVKVNAGAQTITDNNATGPSLAANTASTVLFAGNSTNAFVRQSFNNGGSIQTTCFTFSESFRIDPASSGTMLPYWMITLQDGAGANQENRNYPLSGKWTRGSVTNCFPSSTSTSVLAYAVDVTAAQNTNSGLIIDIANAQLTITAGPVGYDVTTTAVAPLTVGLSAANLALTSPLAVKYGGTQCGAAGLFANLPGSPSSGTTCSLTDAMSCTNGNAVTAGGGPSGFCQVVWNGTAWIASTGSTSGGGPISLAGYTGQVGIQSNQGNNSDFLAGVKLDNVWPLSASGGFASTATQTLTTASGLNAATLGAAGDWTAAVAQKEAHGICFGCGPTIALNTPGAMTIQGAWYVDGVVPATPFQVAISNCVQTLQGPSYVFPGGVRQQLSIAEAYVKSSAASNTGLYSESDAAGTCTVTFNSNDSGNAYRIYFVQSTPTAGTNNYFAYQTDFDTNGGSTAVGTLASLTNVAQQMPTQTMPLEFTTDNTTNVNREKSVIWIAECNDWHSYWWYIKNQSCIKPSLNNANGSFFELASNTGLSANSHAAAEDESGKVTFDGTTTQFTFTLGNTDNISPYSLLINLGVLPDWVGSHVYAANAVVVSRRFSKDPGMHIFQTAAGGTSAATANEPIWCQTSGCTVIDNTVTWTEKGTTGYGGVNDIHDDGSGNIVGKVGLNKQVTDPGTGTNTITSSGSVSMNFATAPWPGMTFTIGYWHAAQPSFAGCQSVGQTCTVGGQTWKNIGTSITAAATPDVFFPAASAFGATAFIDYWGTGKYIASEIPTVVPTAATNDNWFFNMTALTGTAATVHGENGSADTPSQTSAFTIAHDNTVPFASAFTSISAASTSVPPTLGIPPGTWNVYGNLLIGKPTTKIVGSGGIIAFHGDGYGPCTNIYTTSRTASGTTSGTKTVVFAASTLTGSDLRASMTGTNIPANSYIVTVSADGSTATLNNTTSGAGTNTMTIGAFAQVNTGDINFGEGGTLSLGGWLFLHSDNGTADAVLCHPGNGQGFGSFFVQDNDVSVDITSKGNRTTAFANWGSTSLQWRMNTTGFYRVTAMSQANGADFTAGTVGGPPDWPGLFLTPQVCYENASANDHFGPGFVTEQIPNFIGPCDAQVNQNFFGSNGGTQIVSPYSSDWIAVVGDGTRDGPHSLAAGAAGSGGPLMAIDHAVQYNLNGIVELSGAYGGSGSPTFFGNVWLRGASANMYHIHNFNGVGGSYGIEADKGTHVSLDNVWFSNLLGGATCIESRGELNAKGYHCSASVPAANPIVVLRTNYNFDLSTCLYTAVGNAFSGGTIDTWMPETNVVSGANDSPLPGTITWDNCNSTPDYFRLSNSVYQQLTLSLDTANKVWPQIMTETPVFMVTDAGTAGTAWQLPICGGAAATPASRNCATADIGRTFRFWEKATNATPGATTWAAGFHTDNSCAKTLTQNQILTGTFIEQASGVWYQVGECSTTS